MAIRHSADAQADPGKEPLFFCCLSVADLRRVSFAAPKRREKGVMRSFFYLEVHLETCTTNRLYRRNNRPRRTGIGCPGSSRRRRVGRQNLCGGSPGQPDRGPRTGPSPGHAAPGRKTGGAAPTGGAGCRNSGVDFGAKANRGGSNRPACSGPGPPAGARSRNCTTARTGSGSGTGPGPFLGTRSYGVQHGLLPHGADGVG
jgi:hypothetical protein